VERTGGVKADGTIHALVFTPGATKLTRLDAKGKSYDRWTLHTVMVKWIPQCPSTTQTTISFGLDSGAKDTKDYKEEYIGKLYPSHMIQAYQQRQVTFSRANLLQPFMETDLGDNNGTAFTMFYCASKTTGEAVVGHFEFHYDLTFSFPQPFPLSATPPKPKSSEGGSGGNSDHAEISDCDTMSICQRVSQMEVQLAKCLSLLERDRDPIARTDS